MNKPSNKKTCTKQRDERMIQDFKRGMGSEDIYFIYGISISYLREILKEAGLIGYRAKIRTYTKIGEER